MLSARMGRCRVWFGWLPGLEPGLSSSVSKESSVLNDSVLLEVLLVRDSDC